MGFRDDVDQVLRIAALMLEDVVALLDGLRDNHGLVPEELHEETEDENTFLGY